MQADYYQKDCKSLKICVLIAFSLAWNAVSESQKQEIKVFLVVTIIILKFRMDTLSYKTISANKETVKKEWIVVDATDQILGRLGSKVAKLLRGKYKPNYTPHVDCGDNVIIINADKVKLTGKKWTDRVYLRYTGYPGGQREMTPARLMARPNGADKLMRKVVKGMLPKNRLASRLMDNLYVYAGNEHKHEAQNPKMIDINMYK